MRAYVTLVIVSLVTALLGIPPVHAADVLYLRAGRLIIDATKTAMTPGAMVITDGVVTAAAANVTPPDGARRMDLGGLTVMPSLIDAHTHLAGGAPAAQPGQPQPSRRRPTQRSGLRRASSWR